MKRLLYGLIFLAALTVGLLPVILGKGRISYHRVQQPIVYSHWIHTHEKQQLPCKACHRGVETKYKATLPNIKVCSSCHLEPKGKTDKERRMIKMYIEPEKEIPWRRIFVLPDHVFFSHRLHVLRAKLECDTCHGSMDRQKSPPGRPLRVLTMNDCIQCHRQRRVNVDCNTCHR